MTTITTSWALPQNGDWNNPEAWTVEIPQAADTVLITVKGPAYTVTADFPAEAARILEMTQKATLAISSGALHVTSGTGTGALDGTIAVGDDTVLDFGTDAAPTTFDNNGAINLTGSSAIVISGAVTLTGKGKINLESSSSFIDSDITPSTLTNSGNAISGMGNIGDSGLSFVNGAKGIIDANSTGGIEIDTASFTNSGLMEAVGSGSQLVLQDDIEQNGKGQIKASGGQILLQDGATINGGAISIGKNSDLTNDLGNSTIETTTPIKNSGTIGPFGENLTIDGSIKNAGVLNTIFGGNLIIDGSVTGGTAEIGSGNLEFGGASSAKVTFEPGATGLLILDEPAEFKGTVFGMSSAPGAAIDLTNILFADDPSVNYSATKHLLTVADSHTGVTDKIKLVDTGNFSALPGTAGTTDISYAAVGAPPENSVIQLVQSMASFGATSRITGSGTGNLAQNQNAPDFLAANSHHG